MSSLPVRRRPALLPLIVLATGLLVGCGAQGADPGGVDGGGQRVLAGDYVGRPLPAPFATQDLLRVRFGDGELSFSATCNHMSGAADWSGDVLEVSSVGGTEMGCAGDGFAQDEWLVDFFTS